MLPTISLKIERWKFNKDYGIYVSTLGNFKDRHKRNLPIKIDQKGYCRIKTEVPNSPWKQAHRLVMLTWKPIPDAENLTVDHLNHNKRDNSLSNLEWVTMAENQRRAREDFLVEPKVKKVESNVSIETKKQEQQRKKQKYQDRIAGYYINNNFCRDAEEAWNELIKLYPSGYPKKSLNKKIKDLYTGKNTAGQVKLGKKAILKVALTQERSK